MKDVLELATALARQAGALQRQRFHEPREIETKSSAIDLVTDVDKACEELILSQISSKRPDDRVLAEETGAHGEGGGLLWIVDPLDGTVNYAHGFPHFAVSIGVEQNGVREVGVIYDPMRDELFTTRRGGGAFLNDEPIRVSTTTALLQAMLATGFGYQVHQGDDENLEYFVRIIKQARALRRAGSAALDLAYVACGRFDGFWELHLHPWDIAAGLLLIEEAGGQVSDLVGGPVPEAGDRVLATNGALHAPMIDVLG